MIHTSQTIIFVLLADTLTNTQLQTSAPTFILTTSIAHDDLFTARNWYAMFLQSTRLSAV